MKSFAIITDTTSDLPQSFLDENEIPLMHLSYTIGGVTYGSENKLPDKDFYTMMRGGELPTTSQVNPQQAEDVLKKTIGKGYKEILCITFSSGLSGTFNSVSIASEEVMDEDSSVKIKVVDSLCASMGEGLLVYYAVKMRDEGKSLDEVYEWASKMRHNIAHTFTVDDLNHLCRGGRVSKSAAILGTVLNIKPVLIVDKEGHLINVEKVRGRKKALQTLVDSMDEKMGSFRDKNEIIFISHCDAIEDVEIVKNEVENRYGIHNFMINYIGPTIGAHSGPGTVALFFLADEK